MGLIADHAKPSTMSGPQELRIASMYLFNTSHFARFVSKHQYEAPLLVMVSFAFSGLVAHFNLS